MDENTPLLTPTEDPIVPHEQSFRWHLNRTQSFDALGAGRRTLRTIPGVFSPVALSMFSTLLFLRLGFMVGQSGLVLSLLQLILAYFILYMTILSICAISTNGAIEGGGAYYMISRALGPEFGGSIGLLFFLANIVSCALYISGFVEGMIDNFGTNGSFTENTGHGLPSGTFGWNYLYCTMVLAFCLIICLIGGAMFGRTSAIILMVCCVCVLSVIGSMFFVGHRNVDYPSGNFPIATLNETTNHTTKPTLNYTGLDRETFMENLYCKNL